MLKNDKSFMDVENIKEKKERNGILCQNKSH